MIRKILVPLDGSKFAEEALPYAQELGQKFGAELILVRILPDKAIRFSHGQPTFTSHSFQEWEEEAAAYLDAIKDKLDKLQISSRTELLDGNPIATMILDLAHHMDIDLIVMSTHGHSGNERWAYGSVANKVLQQAPCPIFLVRVTDPNARWQMLIETLVNA